MQVCNSFDCYTKDNTKTFHVSVILSDEDALLLNMAYFDFHASPLQPIITTPTKWEPNYYGNHCTLWHKDDRLFLLLLLHKIQRVLDPDPAQEYSSS